MMISLKCGMSVMHMRVSPGALQSVQLTGNDITCSNTPRPRYDQSINDEQCTLLQQCFSSTTLSYQTASED